MKRETLKEMGLEDAVIEKIMAENGRDIERHKAEGEAQKAELEGLRAQVAMANKQIEGFKEMDIEGIKAAAEEWKAKAEKAEADGNAKIEALRFDSVLDSALAGAKSKNHRAVKALLDMDGLQFSEGSILGLNEQLEKIRLENDFLFDSEVPMPQIVKPTQGAASAVNDGFVVSARKAAGLRD